MNQIVSAINAGYEILFRMGSIGKRPALRIDIRHVKSGLQKTGFISTLELSIADPEDDLISDMIGEFRNQFKANPFFRGEKS